MDPYNCPNCGKDVRISKLGTIMEWDTEDGTKKAESDFNKFWVCPFCRSWVYRPTPPA